MASLKHIQDDVAKDEIAKPITVFKKNGELYLGPDGEPCTILVLGSDAKQVRQAADLADRKMVRSLQTDWDPEEARATRIVKASAAITGWTGWTDGEDDHALQFSRENAKALIAPEHILEQVEKAIKLHARFFPAVSSS